VTDKPNEDAVAEQRIVQLARDESPESVEKLVKLAKERLSLEEGIVLKHVVRLVNEERIRLREPSKMEAHALSTYMRSGEARWFWATIFLGAMTTTVVFAIPEGTYPLAYVRYVVGTIFVLWLPGYTFLKALFPSKKDLGTVERFALSIGLSLALVPIVGLVLNYTPWGVKQTPMTVGILALSLALATVAIIREHESEKRA
jgi:hypothetical protein